MDIDSVDGRQHQDRVRLRWSRIGVIVTIMNVVEALIEYNDHAL